MTWVWEDERSLGRYIVAAKGAPEAIIKLCRLGTEETDAIMKQVSAMAAQGLRVLAVAKADFSSAVLPTTQNEFDFSFVGLLGFNDPVRAEVPAAISRCHRAGVRVIMITGDNPTTAKKIADDVGLVSSVG